MEIVEVAYDAPPTADQKRIVETVATLVDKIQLLTGEATTRAELSGTVEPAKRGELVSIVTKLAERATG